jgi:hypothetical protein
MQAQLAALRAEVERATTELQMERIAYGQACDDEKARADRYRKAILDAPHGAYCHERKTRGMAAEKRPCDCWKAAALEEKP